MVGIEHGSMVFNILMGNTDDHARNHACFWDGEFLDLTPAYDVCAQGWLLVASWQTVFSFGDGDILWIV